MTHDMRGRAISPIVSVILVILVAVLGSIALFAWVHDASSDNPTARVNSLSLLSIKAASVDYANGEVKLLVQNSGKASDTVDKVYLLDASDNIVYTWNVSLTLKPGETATLSLPIPGILFKPGEYYVALAGKTSTTARTPLQPSMCSLPTGWSYFRLVSIYNPTTATVDNIPVRIELSSPSFDFSHVKNDASDLRFYTLTCNELPYWIEEWNPTPGEGVVWVKIPRLPPGETRILMVYGNPSASPTSLNDPEQVFVFFDGFDGSSIDSGKWLISTSDYTVSGGWLRIDSGGISSRQTLSTMGIDFSGGEYYIFEAKLKVLSNDGSYDGTVEVTSDNNGDGFTESGNSNGDATILDMRDTDDSTMRAWIGLGNDASYNGGTPALGYSLPNNRESIVGFSVSSDTIVFFNNYTIVHVETGITWYRTLTHFTLGAFDGVSNIDDTTYDWARIRIALPDPSNPEPTVSVGAEQTL